MWYFPFRQETPQPSVEVFIGAFLPWRVGITEESVHGNGSTQCAVAGVFRSTIEGDGEPGQWRQFAQTFDDGGHDGMRGAIGVVAQTDETADTLQQCGDIGAMHALESDAVTLPMAEAGAVIDMLWPLMD